MRGAPIHPDEYDGKHLNNDDKLRATGMAIGLDVWEPVSKAYSNWLADGVVANAQLWSLREAIRAEAALDLAIALRALVQARYEFKEFREKLAALAANLDYLNESGENDARNIREFLAGTGPDDNDPRVQARAWGLEF
jgi:hypothetical protein